MAAVRRRLFTILSVLSLVLCLAAATAYAISLAFTLGQIRATVYRPVRPGTRAAPPNSDTGWILRSGIFYLVYDFNGLPPDLGAAHTTWISSTGLAS